MRITQISQFIHRPWVPLLCAMLLIPPLPMAAELGLDSPDWKEVSNQEGIRIFTRKTQDSDILASKGSCLIEAGAEEILEVLDDNANHTKWIPFLLESRMLERIAEHERLEYNLFDAPWPVSNRDFVYHAKAAVDQETNSITLSLHSVESPLMPKKKGVIRATLIESTFRLKGLNPGQSQVELYFHADPKGWTPTWINNIIQRRWPHFVLKSLRAEIKERTSSPSSNPLKTKSLNN